MYRLKTLNLDEVWQKEQGWNTERKLGRKFDDAAELAFWERIAPTYSQKRNLYREVPGLKERIAELIAPNQKILEIGCGSGNFTIPLAQDAKEILALDFSPAMLKQLALNIKKQEIKNIRMVCSKWEDYTEDYDADFVVSVNSLYRVCYMRRELAKIALYGRKGFVLIRTLIRPFFHKIYKDLGIQYKYSNDHMLIPMMLWDMGIQAEVSFFKHTRKKVYSAWEEVEKEYKDDLGELAYMNFSDQLQDNFYQSAEKTSEGYVYNSEAIIELISYVKE